MAPKQVRADENNRVGQFEVLIDAGHRIGTKCAAVPGNRGSHAQARIGIDVGRADEALHQLVGDVVVLRQKLARDVERHGIGTMHRNRLRKPIRDMIERFLPIDATPVDFGMQQAPLQIERLSQR